MQTVGCNRMCSGHLELAAMQQRAVALTLLMDLILQLLMHLQASLAMLMPR